MRPAVTLVLALALTPPLLVPREAEAASWSAGGWLSASWAGRWPRLDLRGRGGLLVSGGHELGLTLGLSTERLASQLLYQASYTHCWLGGRRWPLVAVWVGGATDLLGALAQTRATVGLSLGLRVPLGERVALRVDLGHELLLGERNADRTFLAVGLEALGGPGWHQGRGRCYPPRRPRRVGARRDGR